MSSLARLARRISSLLVGLSGRALPDRHVSRLADEALRARHGWHEVLRQRKARADPMVVPEIGGADGTNLRRYVLEKNPPWLRARAEEPAVPGMLTPEERLYYAYISRFYSGLGEVVELGPWLGHSTVVIAEALRGHPEFHGRKLFVYDDFVWRKSWMLPAVAGMRVRTPEDHESFQPLFEQYVAQVRPLVSVHRGKFADFDGNGHVPPASWDRGPIELIYVDCGRELGVNEGWWRVFSPSFIVDRTLIVMQDWRHFSRVPELYWENTKLFTDSHAGELSLVHETRGGAIATFIYRRHGRKS